MFNISYSWATRHSPFHTTSVHFSLEGHILSDSACSVRWDRSTGFLVGAQHKQSHSLDFAIWTSAYNSVTGQRTLACVLHTNPCTRSTNVNRGHWSLHCLWAERQPGKTHKTDAGCHEQLNGEGNYQRNSFRSGPESLSRMSKVSSAKGGGWWTS